MTLQALSVALPCVYLASALLYVLAFLVERPARHVRTRRALLASAIALHVGAFAARFAAVDGVPVLGGFVALSAIALCMALLYLWTALLGRNSSDPKSGPGLIVVTVVFALQLASSALAPLDVEPAVGRPAPFYLLHVLSITVASAALVLSGLYGILYLLLFRALRERRFGPLFAGLPSLELLARRTRRAALAAFVLLAVGVNGGIWWAHSADVPGFHYADPGVLIVLLLMVHFGVVAFSSRIPGLTARRASWAASAGFVALLVSLVLFLLPGVSFHWTR